jgi:hypothetical protein
MLVSSPYVAINIRGCRVLPAYDVAAGLQPYHVKRYRFTLLAKEKQKAFHPLLVLLSGKEKRPDLERLCAVDLII